MESNNVYRYIRPGMLFPYTNDIYWCMHQVVTKNQDDYHKTYSFTVLLMCVQKGGEMNHYFYIQQIQYLGMYS